MPWDRMAKQHSEVAPFYSMVYGYRGRTAVEFLPEWMGTAFYFFFHIHIRSQSFSLASTIICGNYRVGCIKFSHPGQKRVP